MIIEVTKWSIEDSWKWCEFLGYMDIKWYKCGRVSIIMIHQYYHDSFLRISVKNDITLYLDTVRLIDTRATCYSSTRILVGTGHSSIAAHLSVVAMKHCPQPLVTRNGHPSRKPRRDVLKICTSFGAVVKPIINHQKPSQTIINRPKISVLFHHP